MKTKENKSWYSFSRYLSKFELAVVAVSFLLVVGFALPGFFRALSDLRGNECTHRLQLIAECLHDLAVKNRAVPGGHICSMFELNDYLMEKQNRATYSIRIGAEPDCADAGDFEVNLVLNPDGTIPYPVCSLGENEAYSRHAMHTLEGWNPDWQEELRVRAAEMQQQAAERAAKVPTETDIDITETVQPTGAETTP